MGVEPCSSSKGCTVFYLENWRNGYHFYGGQQARKLPNAKKLVRQRKEIGLLNTLLCLGDSNGGYLNPSNIEYQLEDKSGASTRGNSSSKSVY
jgi:hypothetical protein